MAAARKTAAVNLASAAMMASRRQEDCYDQDEDDDGLPAPSMSHRPIETVELIETSPLTLKAVAVKAQSADDESG